MTLDAWLAFCAMETVLCFVPGPAVLLVVSVGLGAGMRPGIGASLGVLAGNALYFALSATSVAAVIVASHELFTALKWAGAAYLVWLGLRMLVSPAGARVDVAAGVMPRSFVRGFVVQAGNPKALVFFVALLPQFIDPGAPVAQQVLVLGVSSIVIEFGVLTLYVWSAVRARRLAGARLATPLERAGGACLVLAGARLALAGDK